MLRTQKGVLEAWNIKAVRNGYGVSMAIVILNVENEGADATYLKTGGANAVDGGTGWTKIMELRFERGHCARGLAVDANLE